MSDLIFGNRLLVIDDELAACRAIRNIAERCDFEVVTTTDAETFLRNARHWKPTVIVMDLQMPTEWGIELLRELAAESCDAHVIISGGWDARVIEAATRLGHERGLKMRGALQKPYRVATLRELLSCLANGSKQQLAADLAAALSSHDFFVEYQPRLDHGSRRFVGVEALARWHHARHGLMRPDQFIALAEETHLIHAVTDTVVTRALRQVALWRADNLALELAVNLSAKNAEDDGLPDRLGNLCAAAKIGPEHIVLELSEAGAMRQSVQMMDILDRLRLKGFRLSIDDFGAAYSSLVQLRRLPFTELKIHRSFVRRMLRNDNCEAIVEVTIRLAQRLGLRTVADGVEDAATLEALFALGCDAAQGAYLSRPISAADVELLVRQHHGGGPRTTQAAQNVPPHDR